jgi:hypothetical protein
MQPLSNAAQKLVARVVTERIVHILEVIKVDVENRGAGCRLPDLLDGCLEALAEEYSVWQPAQGIVHGQMPQPRFGGRYGFGGAPHVPQDESGEERKRGEREHDEGNDAIDDLLAGSFWRPSKPGKRLPRFIG